MEQQIFCDGIGRIAVIEGVVRLDLYSYSPTESDANGNPRPILSHRVVLSLDGFLRSSEKVIEAVKLIGQARQQQQAVQKPQPAVPSQPAQQPPAQQAQRPPQWPPQAQAAAAPPPVAPPAPPPPPAPKAPVQASSELPPPPKPPFP